VAHQLDPEDPEIRSEWMPRCRSQRIAEIEAYLASPTGDDPEELRHLRMYLEHLKKLSTEPHKSCHLVSPALSTDSFVNLMYDANHIRAFGLEVKFNNHASRLQIDTGQGLLVSRSVASGGAQIVLARRSGGYRRQGTQIQLYGLRRFHQDWQS